MRFRQMWRRWRMVVASMASICVGNLGWRAWCWWRGRRESEVIVGIARRVEEWRRAGIIARNEPDDEWRS